jgi:cytochrome c7-like protein
MSKCASCHMLGAGAHGLKCLECHAEIRRRVAAKAGYHAQSYKNTIGETDCARCHKEHKGHAATLISLERNNFDHLAQTGFRLEGKHRAQKCENCHTAKKIAASSRPEIKLKDVNRSFLGLRRECTSCHEDQHRGQVGAECTRCHTQEAWKPASGFDHSRAAFVLTGLHQTVSCQKCHAPRPGSKSVQFKGLAFSGCQNCHTDPHRGAFQEVKFRGSCDSCHNTNGWKNNHPASGFNHSTTKFPLSGKHGETACFKCHKGTDFRRPIAHERCRDCHEDPHKAQFAARVAGSDCAACHSDTHFKPSRFDRETHKLSAFPLEAKHEPLACARCHQPEGRDAVYVTRKLICSACHADQHGGEFALAPHANKCDDCHTQTGFKASTFSVARHAQTQFALTGKHASVDCGGCHKPLAPAVVAAALAKDGKAVVKCAGPPHQYRFAARTCNSCHTDPHQTKLPCENCHTAQQWKEVRTFDHSSAKFKIEGAHQEVKCIQCHKPFAAAGSNPAKVVAPGFSKTPGECTACHSAKDPHGGQFSRGGRVEDCSSCHTMMRWKMENFDHDKTVMPLDRAHRHVACEKCHKDQTGADAKMIRVFRDTPKECVKCHP